MTFNYVDPTILNPTDGISVYREGFIRPLSIPLAFKFLNSVQSSTSTHPFYEKDYHTIFAESGESSRLTFIYGLFDQLIEMDTRYGKKQQIGEDEWGNPLYQYIFGSNNLSGGGILAKGSNVNPRILIMGGIHGAEKNSLITIWIIIHEIINTYQTDSWCMEMYSNLEIVILPCCVPSATISATRRNKNGVDINRNFPTDWSHISDGGAGPLSEKDTVNILNWYGSYKGKNIGSIELHDHGSGSLVWGTCAHPLHFKILVSALKDLNRHCYESGLVDDDTPPSNNGRTNRPWSYVTNTVGGGCTRHLAIGERQPSILLEHSGINHPQGGEGMYWPRVTYRYVVRSIISRLIKLHGLYDTGEGVL